MKKKFTAALLTLCMLSSAMPALAFSDIPDKQQSYSAESLASVGILADVDRYNPAGTFTKAEFCKTVVTSLGFAELSTYKSMTIFPDVPHTKWYSAYVNASVRKFKIISGTGSGIFEPEKAISFGEASTILLRVLGYETADIGPFWPRDYVLKAEELGLTEGIGSLSAAQTMSRGQAAIMLRNLMLMNKKDGTQFAGSGFSVRGADAVLSATWETDPRLSRGQVRIYAGDTESVVTAHNNIDSSLVGLRGMPVYDKQNSSRLLGFIADTAGIDTMVVKQANAEKIETTVGELSIPRGTKIVVNGTVTDYSTSWFDIRKDAEIMVYTDSRGAVSLISVRQGGMSAYSSILVYGVDDIVFTSNSTIIKNGSAIKSTDLQSYDIVSYSPKDNTYYVSDNRITLLYENAKPTYTYPESIKAGGLDFTISESAAKYFKSLKLGSTITLLLDNSGSIAAAFESKQVTGKPLAILTELSDTAATATLLNGLVLKGTPSLSGFEKVNDGNQDEVSSLYKSLGRLVTVYQDQNGKLNLSPIGMSAGGAGAVDPVNSKVGTRQFAGDIKIFEEPASGLPLSPLTLSDLGKVALPSTYVKHIQLDSAGNVSLLVLQSITGKGFSYGMVSVKSENAATGQVGLNGEQIMRLQYTYTIKNSSGVKTFSSYYGTDSSITGTASPAAIASGVLSAAHSFSIPTLALKSLATVGRADFDAYYGARVNGVFVPVAENVEVYATSLDRFIPLAEARANFTSFELYCDRDPQYGGVIRLIVAK